MLHEDLVGARFLEIVWLRQLRCLLKLWYHYTHQTGEHNEMGVGPQEHLDIIDKTFKKCVK